jgi:hypothetical protein
VTTPSGAAPAPPPGPGVQPPFVAPPTDGTVQRRWVGVGLAAAAALLCCVGALVGVGSLVVFGGQAIVDETRAAVTNYLTAIQREQYADAYRLLCDEQRARTTETNFARSFATAPRIVSFTVGKPVIAADIEVPANLTYDNFTTVSVTYLLVQDTSTGDFKVCGVKD